MPNVILTSAFELFQIICVVTLVSYFIIRTHVFEQVRTGAGSLRDRVLITLFFGALSVYGTLTSYSFEGSPANVRDLGPIIAGLLFGPWVGLGAGIIGGLFRFSLGGLTVIPCTIATSIAGVFAGFIWYYNKKRFIGVTSAVIFTLMFELFHLVLIILIVGSTPDVLFIIRNLGTTMLLLNIAGIFIFSIIYRNYCTEKKVREAYEREQVELQFAQEIQKSFLPRDPPRIAGYDIFACAYPAKEVGGDFYDYISFDDGRWGFAIADVSGKSVSAALFMALSCTIVRISSIWRQKADQITSEVNNLINRYAETGMFFSLFYCILTPDTGALTYVNAGHPAPVLLRSDGTIEALGQTGTIIGFLEEQNFSEVLTTLFPGDLIVCYTDGVTEARRSDWGMFKEHRLFDAIAGVQHSSAEDIARSIIHEIDRFVEGSPQFDDITLLVIKKHV